MKRGSVTFMQLREAGITRAVAMRFTCPICKAATGEACTGSRQPPQPRKGPHRERYEAAWRWRREHP